MTTSTDTKLHDARIAVSEIVVTRVRDDMDRTDSVVGTDHAWGTHQLILQESATRPPVDGVVTDNNDPESMGNTPANGIDGIYDGTSTTLGTVNGGEVITLLHGDFSSYVTSGTTGAVSDSGKDARIAGVTDGTTNTLMFGRTDGSGASNVVEDVAVKYTMFEGDGLLLGGNAADRLARVDDLGVHSVLRGGDVLDVGDLPVDLGADGRVSSDSGRYSLANGIDGDASRNINNIDLWVGAVALDVGDVLIGVDAAADDGNDPVQPRAAGGSTTLQADPDGQANGIIAVLIGVSVDIQDLLNNGSPTLD